MNAKALRAAMYIADYTIGRLAKEMGTRGYTLGQKISGKREFKLSEVVKLCELLNIKNHEQIIKIFFS